MICMKQEMHTHIGIAMKNTEKHQLFCSTISKQNKMKLTNHGSMSYGQAKKIIRQGYTMHDSELINEAHRICSERYFEMMRRGKI